MEEIKVPNKVVVADKKDNEVTIEIEPCYPGYGVTIGNALRRVLLSSLSGAAVTAVKIKGVDHDFSTIPSVKEDVVEIILNLKGLRLKSHSDNPVRLKLKHKGKGDIKASEVETTSEVEIVDPNYVIATATDDKVDFEMELVVEQGLGYIPVEQRATKDLEIGMIAIDSIYNPVIKVGYQVENVRVGQMTDYDKVILKIQTDGIITGEEAFNQAAKILDDHFNYIGKALGGAKVKEPAKKVIPEEEVKEPAKEKDGVTIDELGLSTRTYNALSKAGIKTLQEISKMSDEELLKLDGFGATALKEIQKVLKKYGLA